jgi:EAL domain
VVGPRPRLRFQDEADELLPGGPHRGWPCASLPNVRYVDRSERHRPHDSLVSFAADTGPLIVAEGIETADELRTPRSLGISHGQGYYLGGPGPMTPSPLGTFLPVPSVSARLGTGAKQPSFPPFGQGAVSTRSARDPRVNRALRIALKGAS